MLVARDIEVVYQRGGDPAASGISFELGPGDGLLLAGERGAGKTTVLRCVLGLAPGAGTVELFGGRPGDPALMRRVGYGPQGRDFIDGLSPRAIVGLVTAIRLGRRDELATLDALERAAIPDLRRDARTLDVEELRRVSLACAIAGDPELVVLDDPWEFPETRDEISRARQRGAAVLAASHDPGGLPQALGRSITLVAGSPE